MENKYYSLGTSENNGIVRIIRILFGMVCIAVAVFWLVFNIKSLKADGTLWITVIFLMGFGSYQVWAGLGRATSFIEFGQSYIRLKKNAILAPSVMNATEIQRIEMFPLNLIIFLKSGKRIMLRFGTTYYETNEKVKDEMLLFAESNNVPLEIIQEKL
jgi:hypothetical protein